MSVIDDAAQAHAALMAPLRDEIARLRSELAKAREALEHALPHLETLHSVTGGEGRKVVWQVIKQARAALAPAKEGELRHQCAKSGRHDHDGCDCTAEELARRAASPEGK